MMHSLSVKSSRFPRSGFTLIEVSLVSVLMAFLALLVSAVWGAFLRPTSDIANRCRINQEARVAADSLMKDLAGSYAENRTEGKSQYKLVGRSQPDGSELKLCFDSGEDPNGIADWSAPDYVVSYYAQDGNLIRWDEDSGLTSVVARDIAAFETQDLGNRQVELRMTFTYRNLSQTYTLIARDP